MVKLWTGKDRSSRSSPTVPQTQKGLLHIMEEFRRETYTADQVGLDTQTTVYIVERCFGDYDLIDLYSDYVAERVKERRYAISQANGKAGTRMVSSVMAGLCSSGRLSATTMPCSAASERPAMPTATVQSMWPTQPTSLILWPTIATVFRATSTRMARSMWPITPTSSTSWPTRNNLWSQRFKA